MPHPGGKLVVFEGADGVGKSTLARQLRQHLARRGIRCAVFSFPGKEPGTLGAHVYRLYHTPAAFGVRAMTPHAVQVLVTAAHIDVIQSRVLPALASGKSVLLDRYWWSTWVYGHHSGVPARFLRQLIRLEQHAWQSVQPAALFLITRSRSAPNRNQSASERGLEQLYHQLATAENARHTIRIIRNDGTIAAAVRSMTKTLRFLDQT